MVLHWVANLLSPISNRYLMLNVNFVNTKKCAFLLLIVALLAEEDLSFDVAWIDSRMNVSKVPYGILSHRGERQLVKSQ
jgi:hypothetical protein